MSSFDLIKNIDKADDVKVVSKPWGYEKWIAPGSPDFKYALKEIFFKTGNRTSLQVHMFKSETNYVLSGKGILLYHPEPFNFDRFFCGGYSKADIEKIMKEMVEVPLTAGVISHLKAGCIHRVVSLDNLLFIEASTTELTDVFRLQDDSGRTHGFIQEEHE